MNELIKNTEEKMIKTLGVLDRDYKAIRAGRANISVLDRITVNFKDSEKVAGVIARNKERIMNDVLAVEITEGTGEGHTGFWNINGEKMFLTVTKVNA